MDDMVTGDTKSTNFSWTCCDLLFLYHAPGFVGFVELVIFAFSPRYIHQKWGHQIMFLNHRAEMDMRESTESTGNKHLMNFDLLISNFFWPGIQHPRKGTKGPCGSRRVPFHRLKLGCCHCRALQGPKKCLNSYRTMFSFFFGGA